LLPKDKACGSYGWDEMGWSGKLPSQGPCKDDGRHRLGSNAQIHCHIVTTHSYTAVGASTNIPNAAQLQASLPTHHERGVGFDDALLHGACHDSAHTGHAKRLVNHKLSQLAL